MIISLVMERLLLPCSGDGLNPIHPSKGCAEKRNPTFYSTQFCKLAARTVNEREATEHPFAKCHRWRRCLFRHFPPIAPSSFLGSRKVSVRNSFFCCGVCFGWFCSALAAIKGRISSSPASLFALTFTRRYAEDINSKGR